MPIRSVAILMAEGVALDSITQRLTAFNIQDEVAAPKFPAVLTKIAVVILYERNGDAEAFRERLTLSSPAGGRILTTETQVNAAARSHRSVHFVWGVKLDGPGDYTFEVETAPLGSESWTPIGHRTLIVREGRPALFPPSPEEMVGKAVESPADSQT